MNVNPLSTVIGCLMRFFGCGAMVAAIASGCATSRPSEGSPVVADPPRTAEPVTPSRAYLSIDRIEPAALAPRPPEGGVPELSARSVRRLQRGRELFAEQRYTEASLEIEKALRLEPNHPVLHREIAVALRAAGIVERVRQHLAKAVAANDDDVVTHYHLGRLSSDDLKYDDAIREFRTALLASNASEQPAYVALCHFHLARALNAEGYLTAAISEYRRFEDSVASLSDSQKAESELASLLQINQGNAGAPISVAYEKLGRYSEAADALQQSISVRKPDPGTREHLARLLMRIGRYDEALVHARSLLSESERAIDLLASIHEAAGHPEQLLVDVEGLYEQDPDRVDYLMAYVDTLQRFERGERAIEVLTDAANRPAAKSVVYWRLADLLSGAGRWSETLSTLAAAVRADELNATTARAKIVQFAEHAEAIRALLGETNAPHLLPDDFASDYLMGELAGEAGRSERAEELLRHSVSLNGAFVEGRAALGSLYLKRYQWQEAIDVLSADAELLSGDSRLQRLCGEAYAGQDDFAQAEEHFRSAQRLNRSDADAMFALAKLYLRTHEARRGLLELKTLLQTSPLHEEGRELYIQVLSEDSERADELSNQLAELKRLSSSPHRIARCLALAKRGFARSSPDWAGYRDILSDALAEHGPDATTYVRLAEGFLADFKAADALELLRKALEIEPDHLEALAQTVPALEQSLQFGEAIDTLKRLLTRHPNRSIWIDRLWNDLMIDQRFDEAYELVTRRLQQAKLSSEQIERYREQAIHALRRAHRTEDRIALVKEWDDATANDATADHARTTQWLLEAYVAAERFDEAVARARIWYERDRLDDEARQSMWWALMRAKRHDEAEQVLLDTLEVDPSNANTRRQMILHLSLAERYDDALELLDNFEANAESDWSWRELRQQVLQSARRYDEMVDLLSSWIQQLEGGQLQFNPRMLNVLQQRIAIAQLLGHRYGQAIQNLRKWIDEVEDDGFRFSYLRLLSQCYQNQSESDQAIAVLEQAYEMAKSDPGVNNDLGYSLADQGIRLDEAEKMIRFALIHDPDNGAYIDSLGWVLYKKARFDESLGWLKKAVHASSGEDPVVYDHLGDALWRNGDREKAVQHWQDSIKHIEQNEDQRNRPDLQELLVRVHAKIEAHSAGNEPQVAPIGAERSTDPPADGR